MCSLVATRTLDTARSYGCGARHTRVVARAATISVTVTEIFDTTPTLCQVCGERPGTVRMVFAAGPQRRTAVLCETCATELKSRRPSKQEGALDEFGRDLTAEAAAGRIDPVIGRSEEIAETVEILARRRKN